MRLGSIVKLLVISLGALPLRFRIWLGGLLGSIYSFIPTNERRIAKLQVQSFLQPANADRVVKDVFSQLGQTVFESLNLFPILDNSENRIEWFNYDLFKKALKKDNGVIALSAHLSNWDLLAAYSIKRDIPLVTFGRKARNASFQEALNWLRERYSIDTIWRDDKSAVRKTMQALKQGKCVAALIDQDTRVGSEFVPFFQLPAKTPVGVIKIAKKCDSAIFTAFICRTAPARFEIHFSEIDPNQSVEEILAEYNRKLEAFIKEHPAQWVWFHKRWKSRPEGDLRTAEYLEFLEKRACNE